MCWKFGMREMDCNAIKVDHVTADQSKDGHFHKLPEDETHEKWNRTNFALDVPDSKPRIKPGRHCGLCGGGTDGKAPIILVQDGAGSDNEVYSGDNEAYSASSSPKEPNYDVWDGFGDKSGWLGQLLGPINDCFGIAGIWVHQQCAVWSPEVCGYILTFIHLFFIPVETMVVSRYMLLV
ncbi:P-loop containing nucleoside triphosphate hydrolase superfamily protein [Abeliophyllum distichum]|uniref:P-loop containing nucleoside triphosphate hydrolase superfamily protein n=1 Tax=Abeliophyllum distichum TaxID=126358 RepID=A0ABD1PS97_9LAMI